MLAGPEIHIQCRAFAEPVSMTEARIIVGGSLEEDAAAFLDAWHRAERGENVDENVLAFESWEALLAFIAQLDPTV